MFAAQRRLAGPKLHVTVRKAFGFGSSVMAMNPFDGQTISLAFPAVTLGALPAASGGRVGEAHDDEQAAAEIAQASAVRTAARTAWASTTSSTRRDLRNALLAGLSLARSGR